MSLKHPDPRPERVVKSVTPRFNPEHHPHDQQIEKENDMGHVTIGKRDGDDGGAAGDGPVGSNIEPLAPNHDPPELAPIEMGHGIDIARIIKAPLN